MDAYQHQNFSTHLKSTLKGWSDAKERPESSAGTLCFPSFIGSRRAKKPRGCNEAALTIPAEPRARYSPPNTASNYFSAHNKCPGRPQDTCQCPRRLPLHLTQGEATRTVWGARSPLQGAEQAHTTCSTHSLFLLENKIYIETPTLAVLVESSSITAGCQNSPSLFVLQPD